MFTLTADGPPQGTYRFSHAALSSFNLFVVPVGQGRRTYEAVIYAR
jgi:hypothetical protein